MNELNLNSDKIYEKEFKTCANGYDPFEVDKYLDLIINDYVNLEKEIERLKALVMTYEKENLSLKNQLNHQSFDANPKLDGSNLQIIKRLSRIEFLLDQLNKEK